MTPMVVNALKEWRLAAPSRATLVFPGRGGGPLATTAVAAWRCGRTGIGISTRQWLIDQGFGPKRVQALMGHSSIQITFDVYGHLFPAEDDHARFASGGAGAGRVGGRP